MNGYTYQTFPGCTVVRTAQSDGYPWDELLKELHLNGDGTVTDDEERTDERIAGIVGRECRDLWHPAGCSCGSPDCPEWQAALRGDA